MEYQKEKNSLVIYIKGELGNYEARKILQDIDTILTLYPSENIVADLSGITFMDSSGIAVLMKILKLSKGNRDFCVRNVPNLAMKIFKTSGVVNFINFV